MMTKGLSLGAAIFFLMVGGTAFAAEPTASSLAPSDKEALSGLSEVKVIFDITTGDAKKLLSRLGLIEETRDAIRQQGATPRIILAFRGPASLYIQTNESRVKIEDLDTMKKIQDKLKAMSKDKSYRLAQCAVANRYLKVNNDDTIPEVEVVGNSFISMAAYQNKGYAYLPID